MKLNVTFSIALLERGFNTEALYTDADLSDLNTLGEDCKRILQAMSCQLLEPCDTIYKELKANENIQKMNGIWDVCQTTANTLTKFNKATGGGDMIRNMNALIELVKEHLSFRILAIESKSSVCDHEREDFKSECEDVISNLLSTITSKMAKSDQKSKTSGSRALLITDTILPGQEKNYCIVDFYVVIQRSIWKVTGSPEMFMTFLVPTDNRVKSVVVGPLQIEREAGDVCVRYLRLYVSDKLIGYRISYKYQIYSPEFITSDEFLFCHKPEENTSCYRILNLPWDRDEKTKVYNGCVYPTECDEQNIAKKFYNLVFSPYLKIPNRSNELEISFRAYLEDRFESIMQSRLSNWTMVHNNYHTIQTVYRELDSTKIRNIHTSDEVNYFSQNNCIKVLYSNLMDLIQKTVNQPYRPERIFSFLLLCRCFIDLMKVDVTALTGELLSLLPNDIKYTTEYKMLQTSITSIKDSQQYFNAMKVVMKTSMKSGALSDPSWVKAFPLYSWFCSSQKHLPNETLDCSPSSITKKLKSLDRLFGSFLVEKNAIRGVLNGLNHSLLEVDPMLRLALFRICPESKYSLLIPYVPVPVILTGISMRIESLGMNLTIDMLSYFVVFLSKLLSEERNLNEHVAVANSVSCIVTSLDKSESLQSICNTRGFDTFVILCAKVITLMYQHSPEELKENRYHDFIPLINKWSSGCFGEHFVKSEHSFWLKLNSSIKSEEWEHILQKIIQGRFEKLKYFSDKVKVLENLQSEKETDFVIVAIENVVETQSQKDYILQKNYEEVLQKLQKDNRTLQQNYEKVQRDYQQLQTLLEQKDRHHHNEKTTLQQECLKLQQDHTKVLEDYQQLQTVFEQKKRDHENEKTRLEEQIRKLEINWNVTHTDVQITKEKLGRGGWGVIQVGLFREQRVAVKQLYEVIISEENLLLMNREINTMSKLRHPNLLLFIGAVLDHPSGNPLIITEIMDASLRSVYERNQLTNEMAKLIILRDVAAGLNYLHCLDDPIIHRDVSSANVLLESKGPDRWKAKLSDFGSANIARDATTKAAGALVYSAPESLATVAVKVRKKQTTKMDVFSFGVLLCEIMTCRFPDLDRFHEMLQNLATSSPPIAQLICTCVEEEAENRPTIRTVIQHLDQRMKSLTK